jgi:hypothetical protein
MILSIIRDKGLGRYGKYCGVSFSGFAISGAKGANKGLFNTILSLLLFVFALVGCVSIFIMSELHVNDSASQFGV